MNILIIGDQPKSLTRLNSLLEITFPKAMIATGNIANSYQYIMEYQDKWNLLIFLPFLEDSKIESMELLSMCESLHLPSLCIVNRESESYYRDILKIGVKGIVAHDAPLDILLDGIRFITEGGMYFDPKIVKNFNLLESVRLFHKKEDPPQLSKIQWEIFNLIAIGKSIEDISVSLNEEPSIVLEQQEGIMRKTNSKTAAGAIAKGIHHGWLRKI